MMRVVGLLVMWTLILAAPPKMWADDKCFSCHQSLGDRASDLFARDVHHLKGITCAGCHGGNARSEDMEEAMSKAAGFQGVPKGDEISKACAKCHSSTESMKRYGSSLPTGQLEQLQASVHGNLATSGKEHIAQCSTCHNAHGIASVKNVSSPVHPLQVVKTCTSCHANASFMKTYNPSLPVDQLEKYRTSVHGIRNSRGDHKVAECASCHGSHDIRAAKDVKSTVYATNLPTTCATCHSRADYMKEYKIPVDQFEKFSNSVHGVALLEKHDLAAPACNDCHGNHGAAPPGIASVSNVCGTCHALNADLFSASPHKKAFDERKLPECETCHGNHEIIVATNKLLGVTADAVCSTCHSETQNVRGYEVAASMRALIDSLDEEEQRAIALVDEAEQKGMEISEAKLKLRDARQARLEARTMIHSFSGEKLEGVVAKGLNIASAASLEAQQALDDYVFRRIGLGIATLVITVLVISLYLFIRRLERRP